MNPTLPGTVQIGPFYIISWWNNLLFEQNVMIYWYAVIRVKEGDLGARLTAVEVQLVLSFACSSPAGGMLFGVSGLLLLLLFT